MMASSLDNMMLWPLCRCPKQNYCYFLKSNCRLVASHSSQISSDAIDRNYSAKIAAAAAADNHYRTLVSPAWWPHAMATDGNSAVVVWCSSTTMAWQSECPVWCNACTKQRDCNRWKNSIADAGIAAVCSNCYTKWAKKRKIDARYVCKDFFFHFSYVCFSSIIYGRPFQFAQIEWARRREKKWKWEMECGVLTVKRSGQHGIAAKISYAYIVPSTNDEPFHFLAQNLNIESRRKQYCEWIYCALLLVAADDKRNQKIHIALAADWGQNLRCTIFNFLTCIELCVPARHLQDIPCTPMSSTGSVLRILPFLGMQDKNTFFNLFIFCVLVSAHFHRSTLPPLGDGTRLWRTSRKTINFHFHFIVFFFGCCRRQLVGSRSPHLLSKLILRITDTYLNASRCMLFWAEEKCAIDEWISVKYKHRLLAEYARYATLLMLRQRRQYEQSGLVVAMIPFVFHLHRHTHNKKIMRKIDKSLKFIQTFKSNTEKIGLIAETRFLRNSFCDRWHVFVISLFASRSSRQ